MGQYWWRFINVSFVNIEDDLELWSFEKLKPLTNFLPLQCLLPLIFARYIFIPHWELEEIMTVVSEPFRLRIFTFVGDNI